MAITSNIVVDLDDTIVNIADLWVRLIHENRDYFEKYFNLLPDEIVQNPTLLRAVVYSREIFSLLDWLKKDSFDSESDEIKEEVTNFFYSLYNNPKFYDYVTFTSLGNFFRDFSAMKYFNKIYIVSRCTSPENAKSKEAFVKKHFDNPKIKFVGLDRDAKKSDLINTIGDIDTVVDDEKSNIIDIMKNCEGEMELYIPKLGYNIFNEDEDLSELKYSDNKLIYNYDINGTILH